MYAIEMQPKERMEAQRPHVLVVDDEAPVATLLQHLLEREGEFRVTWADDGYEALERLQAGDIDMVITDDTMPRIDGWELVRLIRADSRWAHLPIMMLSSGSEASAISLALDAGADDYMSKMVIPRLMISRVRMHTDRARLADENARLEAALHESQQAQAHVTRIVAHELKGPLTNLRMAQFLLREMLDDEGQVRTILDNVDATLDSMSRVISTFLDFDELRTSVMTLRPTLAQPILEQAVAMHAEAAAQKSIDIRLLPTDAALVADAYLLVQVMSNLVSNGVKYSPSGAVVTVGAEAADDTVALYVSDQGAGVPANERHRLFEMFSRLTTRPTGAESSTGLGLWIVKQLTEMQGGSVDAQFPKDGGSVFKVLFPTAIL